MLKKFLAFIVIFSLCFNVQAGTITSKSRIGGVPAKTVTQGVIRNAKAVMPLVPSWYAAVSVGNLPATGDWQEVSSVSTPKRPENAHFCWINSDSPSDIVAAVSNVDASAQGIWTLEGIGATSDWEDTETGSVNGIPYLYIFDFGNNPNAENSRGAGVDMRIFRCVEPIITGSDGTIPAADIITISAVFPGGAEAPTHRDCEATIVDPDTGDIYIITKREAIPGVYKLAHASTYVGIQTLTYMGKMFDIPDVRTSALGTAAVNTTDAAISPNGKEILVRNYDNIYFFPRNKATQTIYQALSQTGTPILGDTGGGSTDYPKKHAVQQPQSEGIAFSQDGKDIYCSGEYVSGQGSAADAYPFFRLARVPKSATTVILQDGLNDYAGTLDTYVWDGTVTAARGDTAYGTEVTVVADTITAGAQTDQRWSMMKFDLSSIPSNATIVSARLDLYLAVEGQGWSLYKMLTNWSETSTFNALDGFNTLPATVATSTAEGVFGTYMDTLQLIYIREMVLASTVQSWVNGTSANYGWLIKGTDTAGDGVQFASREAVAQAQHPKLTIEYYV